MSRRLLVLLSLAGASLLGVFAAACGDDSTTTDGGTDATASDTGTGNDTGTGKDAASDTGTGNDTGTGGDGSTDAGSSTCVGSDAGCLACCQALHPDAGAFRQAAITACACVTPGDCKANNKCGQTLCQGNAPSGACDTCLADPQSGDCNDAGTAACLADPDCAAALACATSCGDGG